jgi:hypothetical protein
MSITYTYVNNLGHYRYSGSISETDIHLNLYELIVSLSYY